MTTFTPPLAAGTSDDLFLCAQELLETCADAVATTRGGQIGRAFVSAGPPAFDCAGGGQLTVHVGSLVTGDTLPLQPPLQPGQRANYGMILNLVPLIVTVIRCATLMDDQSALLPDIDDMQNDAAVSFADAWAIWNFTRERKASGLLFPGDRREFFMDPGYAIAASGGVVGWQLPFRVQLSGYLHRSVT